MSKKILIVDDEEMLTTTLAVFFGRDYTVLTAEDGEKAEETIKKENLQVQIVKGVTPI